MATCKTKAAGQPGSEQTAHLTADGQGSRGRGEGGHGTAGAGHVPAWRAGFTATDLSEALLSICCIFPKSRRVTLCRVPRRLQPRGHRFQQNDHALFQAHNANFY